MSNITFNIVQSGEDAFVTAFIPGEALPLVGSKSGTPRFAELLTVATEAITGISDPDVDEVRNLFSPAAAVAERFEQVSERVIVEGGTVLFDGTPVNNSITKQIVRFLDDGEDFEPLVNFMERVENNPNEHSRTQLFDWLNQRDFTITPDGKIVMYKGVARDGDSYRSISGGSEPVYVTVDGETTRHTGRIPNPVGGVVSMDRNLVQHDPSLGCHVGLHCANFEYASSWSHGTVLEVHVDPRDVVSVPTDCSWQKVRTCRYEVVDTIDVPYTSGLIDVDGYDEDDEGEYASWEDFDF